MQLAPPFKLIAPALPVLIYLLLCCCVGLGNLLVCQLPQRRQLLPGGICLLTYLQDSRTV